MNKEELHQRAERRRIKKMEEQVHRALGCTWVYLTWYDPPTGPTIRVPSFSEGESTCRVCPVCGKWQQRNVNFPWKVPHIRKSHYYAESLRIAREFVSKEK